MKKIIAYPFIVSSFAIQILQADLLSGPYSVESKELIKLAQNSTLPIPDNLKNRIELIELLRSWISDDLLFLNAKNTALIHDPISLEAAIQAIMLTPTQKYNKDTLQDQHLVLVYFLARELKNRELLAAVIKAMPQKMRDSLIASEIVQLAIFLRSDEDRKSYDDQKEVVKTLIAQSENSDEAIKRYAYRAALAMLLQKNIKELLDFLLSLGLPINYIDSQAKKKETLLDVVNGLLAQEEYKNDKDVIEIREYLLSKGAKPYTELQK